MGREIKRVSPKFNWPLDIVWKGFINPYSATRCKICDGSGLNKATKQLSDDWYSFDKTERYAGWCYHLEQEDVNALVKGGRLWDFTHVPINDEQREVVRKRIEAGNNSWLPYENGRIPTADEVNEWSKHGMGHDSINQWICVEARAKRLGIYGKCEHCEGHGEYYCQKKYRKLAENWKPIPPPKGKGYQLWETVSEGSPITPVFETKEELVDYLVKYGDSWDQKRGNGGWSREVASKFVGVGWAPSLVTTVVDGNLKVLQPRDGQL